MAALSTPRTTLSIVVALVAACGSLVVLSPGASAADPPCYVKNVSTGHVYAGSGPNLQTAIDAAASGVSLHIQGTCEGAFTIRHNVSLVGVKSPTYPEKATLDGDHQGTVLTVMKTKVWIRNLVITNGEAPEGAGIDSRGSVTLNGHTAVTGNHAAWGAGVFSNQGALTMNNASSISDNTTDNYGGGVYVNLGALTMNDSSTITGNRASHGGGVYSYQDTFTMNDASRVSGNTSTGDGGGIAHYDAPLTLNDSAKVSGNTAGGDGGGIWSIGGPGVPTLGGSASVVGNTAAGVGGGIDNFGNAKVYVCDGPNDFWTGAISPNTPDDPPTEVQTTC
jgi:hypothetical protein